MRRSPIAVLAVALTMSFGCAKRLERTTSPDVRAVDKSAPFIKAHMRDGSVYILDNWSVDASGLRLSGHGRKLDAERAQTEQGWFNVNVGDVALFETNVVHQASTIVPMALITGASAALTVFCLTNTKACFGSCPTFYAPDANGRPVLQAEGFSDSIAPSLERRDVDALFRTRATGRTLELRMTNEALETHVVKEANLLALPAPPGGRVLADADGRFWEARALAAPTACSAPEGNCLPSVVAFDDAERSSVADEHDLARREELDLRFPPAAAGA